MADMTHAARARTWLDDPANRVPDDLAATLNASLAESTATREVTTAIVAQTREFTTRLHDIASALEPDAGLVRVSSDPALFLNPAQVVGVTQTEAGVDIHTTNSSQGYTLLGETAEDVAAKLGVSA